MLPRKFFENLRNVIAILVLFVQFVRKFCFKFFTSNFESFTKYDAMMHFARTFRFMLARCKIIVIEEVQNYGKIVFIKKIFEKWLVGEGRMHSCIPHIPPGSTLAHL